VTAAAAPGHSEGFSTGTRLPMPNRVRLVCVPAPAGDGGRLDEHGGAGMTARLVPPSRAAVLDAAIVAVGSTIGAINVIRWVAAPPAGSPWLALAPLIVIVLAQFPLIVSKRGGDSVIGFESCVLVYLTLTTSSLQACALWAIGTTVAHAFQRKSFGARAFNIGLTNLLGPILVRLLTEAKPIGSSVWGELLKVSGACAVYFLLDIVLTGLSLATEGHGPLRDVIPMRRVWLPLACFVGIDTLGYLAALMYQRLPGAALALLLVPVGSIVIAARAVSRARLHEHRLIALFDAASMVNHLPESAELDAAVARHAERVLRRTTACWRHTPPFGREIGAKLAVDGRSDRYLIARRLGSSGQYFDADDQRALDALMAVATDSLERRRLVDEMAFLAQHDPLTGLANRTLLVDRLSHALVLAARGGRTICVLYLDLDGFKAVNDRLGHPAGDELLMAVAERLRTCTRDTDTLARLGGDEFFVLLEEIRGDEEAFEVAGRVLGAMASTFVVDGSDVGISASIGVAFGRDATDAADLLRNADLALYRAKTLSGDRVEAFEPALRTANKQRMELEEELRLALKRNAIEVHYQPIVQLATGTVTGFEALARWHHPQLGTIPADVFIPLAEQIGLISELGERILRRAVAEAGALVAAADRPLSMAVNVSAVQLAQQSFPPLVAEMAQAHEAVQLVLELTESTLLGEDGATAATLEAVRESGVCLSVDDFGVGYSSISYLHRLTVDSLKIDKSFVQRLPEDIRAATLVEGVAAMAHALDIRLIAEGIENAAAAAFMHSLGCDSGQGWYFSAAVPLTAAIDLVRQRFDVGGLAALRAIPQPQPQRHRYRAAR